MLRSERLIQSAVAMVPTWCLDKTEHRVGEALGQGIQIYSLHDPNERHLAIHQRLEEWILADYSRHTEEPDHSVRTDSLLKIPEDVETDFPEPNALDIEALTRDLAVRWLRRFDDTIEWDKLFAYIDRVRYRTYENDAVSVTLVIDPTHDHEAGPSITASEYQKVLDMAATSRETYIRVDRYLRCIEYATAPFTAPAVRLRFAPDFTTHVWSAAKRCYVVEKTRRGDILISRPDVGLIASWRKGFWYVYDRHAMARVFRDVFGPDAEGLIDLTFDLSYRRHGALLVYDPDGVLKVSKRRLSNPNSQVRRIGHDRRDAHTVLGPSVRGIRPQALNANERRVLAEIASMDGAVVFDKKGIYSFGSMVTMHKDVGNVEGGARTTAMHSARRHGALPIKISADGEVMFFFPNNVTGKDIVVEYA